MRKAPRSEKLLYGLTDRKLKELRSVASDPSAKLQSHFQSLNQFTALMVSHARNEAKCGQKDSARHWFRFLSNSQVLPILKDCGYEVTELEESLNLLGLECHPLDIPSFTNDLAAIKHALGVLLSTQANNAKETQTVSHFDAGRSGLGEHERTQVTASNARKSFPVVRLD